MGLRREALTLERPAGETFEAFFEDRYEPLLSGCFDSTCRPSKADLGRIDRMRAKRPPVRGR